VKGQALTRGIVVNPRGRLAWLKGKRHPLRQQEEFRPSGPRERPLVFVAQDEPVHVTNLELYRRLAIPTGLLSLQEVTKEALLQIDPVVGIELGPMRAAVNF
jgi:hypothetical protein